MRRPALALSAALLVALVPVSGRAAAPVAPVAPVSFPASSQPVLAAYGASGMLLVTTSPPAQELSTVTARTGDGSGWSAPVVLGSSAFTPYDPPRVALARDGSGVVAWASSPSPGSYRGQVSVAVRRLDGGFDPATVLPRKAAFLVGAAASRNGHLALLVGSGAGRSFVATYDDGWTLTRVPAEDPAYDPTAIAVDNHGTVHLAFLTVPRGGDGWAATRRLSVTGAWSRPVRVPGAEHMVESVQLAVAAGGRETLAIGYASTKWRSTTDTEAYWTTGHRVVTQSAPGGAYRIAWDRPGAARLALATQGRRVRVLWEQYAAPDARRRPTRLKVRTKQLEPKAPAETLAAFAPSFDTGYDYAQGLTGLAVTMGPRTAAAVWRDAGGAHAWWLGHGTTALPGPEGTVPAYDVAAGVLLSGGAPWAAWEHDRQGSVGEEGDATLTDATVSVAELG